MYGKKVSLQNQCRNALLLAFALLLAVSGTTAVHAEEGEAELDITSGVIAASGNAANVTFVGDTTSGVLQLLASMNMTWANNLITTPSGTTRFYTGATNQIAGNTGVTFNIPMDKASTLQGVAGVASLMTLTEDNIGKDTYASMVRDMRAMTDQHELDGNLLYFVPKDPAFLTRYGIQVFSTFSNGSTFEVTRYSDYGVLLNNADQGSLPVVMGGVFADGDPVDGQLWKVIDVGGGATKTIFFDGKKDGVLNSTFWMTKSEADAPSSGSSGCNSGLFALPLLGGLLAVFAVARKTTL